MNLSSTATATAPAPAPVTLEVVHETRYDYGAPVSLAHHLAHLQPLADAAQAVHAHTVQIGPTPTYRHAGTDAFGNGCLHFMLAQPHRALVVRTTSVVAVATRFAALRPEASPPWDELAAQLRYVARAPFEPALAFAQLLRLLEGVADSGVAAGLLEARYRIPLGELAAGGGQA
jgi:transglutaminase-like putative cysteine protease